MTTQLLAFILYFAVVLGIGLLFFFKSKGGGEKDYFLGGRSMGPWVTALSAQASDMSGWLLMGFPGSILAFGMGQVWIGIGLALGTAANWIFVARRLGLEAYGVTSDLRDYGGQIFRDIREILARNKDLVYTIVQPEPTYLGEAIPVQGDGNLTNDK